MSTAMERLAELRSSKMAREASGGREEASAALPSWVGEKRSSSMEMKEFWRSISRE